MWRRGTDARLTRLLSGVLRVRVVGHHAVRQHRELVPPVRLRALRQPPPRVGLSHVTRMALAVETDEALDPGEVGLFRPVVEMADPDSFPYPVRQVRPPHCG